jgi:PAS domain S-box-containing protein
VDLRKKTLAIICITLLSLLLVLLVLSEIVVLGGFSETELRSAEKDTNRALVALGNDINTLDAMAADWASRDDTRAVLTGTSSALVWERLSLDSFERLQFNYIILSDASRGVVAGEGYDLYAHRQKAIPEELRSLLLSKNVSSTQLNATTGIIGIQQLPEGPLMLVIRPVYADPGRLDVIGYILMGRYLDNTEVARLSSMAQLPLVMYNYNDPTLPEDFKYAAAGLVSQPGSFIQREGAEYMMVDAPMTSLILNSNTLATYSLIRDIYGQPALIMRVSIIRDIYDRGRSTTLYFIGLIIAAGLIFGLVILLLLERTILSRVSSLSSRVNFIGKKRDFSARIAISGDDEIAALGNDVNGMIGELELSQKQVRQRLIQSEENYRLFFNSITDPVIIYRFSGGDLTGSVIEANDAATEVLGYSREELQALSPAAIVMPDEGEGTLPLTGRLWADGYVLFESSYRIRGGKSIPVEINARVFDYFGQKAVLAIARDITERHDIERLKMEAFQQIEQNMQQFALLNDHIRNPVQGIIGISDLMQNEYSEKIIRLAHVINDIIHKLDQGYIESEKIYDFLRKYYGVGKK